MVPAVVALLGMLSALLPSAAHAEKRIAFVVGIDKYDNLGPQAQLQEGAERCSGGRTVAEGHWLRRDREGRCHFDQPSTAARQDCLNKLTPGDTAAFYFAGHGVEFAGRNYLLPRDVPNLKPGRDELPQA